MHDAVVEFVWDAVEMEGPFCSVLEFGSKDVNGSIRELFDAEHYVGVDILEGPGVDIVADAATFDTNDRFDCVVCCEVLEHTDEAEAILKNACRLLEAGGVFIMTCAGPGRPAHSAFDEKPIRADEFYRNVDDGALDGWLRAAGFNEWMISPKGLDMRCVAWR